MGLTAMCSILYTNDDFDEFLKEKHKKDMADLLANIKNGVIVPRIYIREPSTFDQLSWGLGMMSISPSLYLLNHNRYFRLGFGKHKGRVVFRAAGKLIEKIIGKGHIDFWMGGKL